MARCPSCRRSFRVPEDEDDGQHPCPFCGYGDEPDWIEPEEDEEEADDDDSD